jgi:hypothetical protein
MNQEVKEAAYTDTPIRVAGVPEIGERKSSWDFEEALFYLG